MTAPDFQSAMAQMQADAKQADTRMKRAQEAGGAVSNQGPGERDGRGLDDQVIQVPDKRVIQGEIGKIQGAELILGRASLKALVGTIAECTGVTVDEILGPRRQPHIARVRQYAYYRARKMGLSYPRIGRFFGRDHTTIMLGVRRIEGLLEAAASQEGSAQ